MSLSVGAAIRRLIEKQTVRNINTRMPILAFLLAVARSFAIVEPMAAPRGSTLGGPPTSTKRTPGVFGERGSQASPGEPAMGCLSDRSARADS